MKWLLIILCVVLALAVFILITAFICFYMAFYARNSKKVRPDFEIPPGKEYEPYAEQMLGWMREAKAMPYTAVEVKSFDGLTLRGKYYEQQKGAPVELMFHGYRGSAERDLCGGIQRGFKLGRNVLIADQRAHGHSGGNIITFGLKESRDCLSWINYVNSRFGTDTKIYLCGISMGAATVMMAAGEDLPDNVAGILADCGYSNTRDIICKVISQMHLPAGLLYPFVRLGARLFGGFDPDAATPEQALKNCKKPIVFIHGEADNFVPCEMSRTCFNATPSKKRLLTVKGAGHGAAYLVDPQKYLATLSEFFTP